MIFRILGCCAVLAGPVWAGDWTRLNGVEIEAALNDTKLRYDGAEQVFYASGKTLYDNGRPSWGNWMVRGDDYCSEWPPAGGWACYAVDRQHGVEKLRFVSETGTTTEGTIME